MHSQLCFIHIYDKQSSLFHQHLSCIQCSLHTVYPSCLRFSCQSSITPIRSSYLLNQTFFRSHYMSISLQYHLLCLISQLSNNSSSPSNLFSPYYFIHVIHICTSQTPQLHSISSLLLPYSKFQSHTVQSVSLFLHMTFSRYLFQVIYTYTLSSFFYTSFLLLSF